MSCLTMMSAARPAWRAKASVAVGLALSATVGVVAPAEAQTPAIYVFCYVPTSGSAYRIKTTNAPTKCTSTTHFEFTVTDGLAALRSGDAAGGDLSGTYPNPSVSKLQGTAISGDAPTDGQVLTYDAASSLWKPVAAQAGVTDHGQLTGLPNDDHPQYLRTDGARTLTGALNAGGFKLTGVSPGTTAGDAVEYAQFDALAAHTVKSGDAAGGDLSATYPHPRVVALQGRLVSPDAPVSGNVLTFNGTSWGPAAPVAGVTDHGALSGLADDDHAQYLLASGARSLSGNLLAGGFKVTGLAPATSPGDAVSFEQAVKFTDAAGGDVTGTFPNLRVVKILGWDIAPSPAPAVGRILTWDGTRIVWAAPPSGGTGGGGDGTPLNTPGTLVQRDATGGFSAGAVNFTGLNVTGITRLTGSLNVNAARFLVNADGGFVAAGGTGGAIPAIGNGARLMWHAGKAAFRAGFADHSEWDDPNVGVFSVAMGRTTIARGVASVAFGTGTSATAESAIALGNSTTASGFASTALGVGAIASGDQSIALGTSASTIASGSQSIAMGSHASTNGHAGAFVYGDASGTSVVQAITRNEFVVRAAGGFRFRSAPDLSTGCDISSGLGVGGILTCSNQITSLSGGFRFPDGTVQTTAATSATALGTAANEPGALVKRDVAGGFSAGNVILDQLGVNGSASFAFQNVRVDANGGLVATASLTGTAPASGPGYRFMWHPGRGALRAGGVSGTQWDDGVIGLASAALGAGTTASGSASIALGDGTTASGDAATAMGLVTTARGIASTAMGEGTMATGRGSTAMGTNTRAHGDYSTAIGMNAKISGFVGAFVYGDASAPGGAWVDAIVDNQFVVRAQHFWLGTTSNVTNPAGHFLTTSTGAHLTVGGAWTNSSDVNRKHLFRSTDGEWLLGQLAALPIQSWSYRAENELVRHLGPTAQDFRAAFALGASETGIATVDADGVSLLAAQALERRTRMLAKENAALRADLENVRRAYDDLAHRLERLEGRDAAPAALPEPPNR